MHTMKDLQLLLKSLKSDAVRKGFEMVIEPSELDDELFILANPENHKCACVGLTEINNTTIIVSYSINVKRWGWYSEEGFSLDEMVETDNIKKDIFNFLPADDILTYLHK